MIENLTRCVLAMLGLVVAIRSIDSRMFFCTPHWFVVLLSIFFVARLFELARDYAAFAKFVNRVNRPSLPTFLERLKYVYGLSDNTYLNLLLVVVPAYISMLLHDHYASDSSTEICYRVLFGTYPQVVWMAFLAWVYIIVSAKYALLFDQRNERLDTMSIGASSAWAYYVAYLKLVVCDRYWQNGVLNDDALNSPLLHILIPSNPAAISDLVSFQGVEGATQLPAIELDVAGTKGRKFNLTKYKVGEGAYIMEYPSSLNTLNNIRKAKQSMLSQTALEVECLTFYDVLLNIIQYDPQLKNRVKLVYFDSNKADNIRDLLRF